MPRAPSKPVVAAAHFMNACRAAGVKATHQRLEILQELAAACDHPSAEQVHSRVRRRLPTLSLDTVYRALALFERCGLARKLMTLDGSGRFDGRRSPHHHVVCTQCRRIVDLSWPGFDRLALPAPLKRWGRVAARQAHLTGLCHDCLKERRR